MVQLWVCWIRFKHFKDKENKYLQVGGVSYMLWMLDCFHSLDKMVNLLKSHQEVHNEIMTEFFKCLFHY